MTRTIAEALQSLEQFAAPYVAATQALSGNPLCEGISIPDLIELTEEFPKEECSARALLVYNLKTYNLNQEERRAFIDLVEWGEERTLIQLPARELPDRLESLRLRVGDSISIRSVVYPSNMKMWGRWLR